MPIAVADESKGLLHRAVRHARPLSRQGIQERLFAAWFNGLVYNQIWEDPKVDAEALQMVPNTRVLTISSAGCNALNYLINDPAAVTAVDLNHHHLALTRLKIAAVRYLPDYESLFAFFGCGDDPQNVDNFDRFIAPHLDESTRRYWHKPSGLHSRRIEWFAHGFYKRSRLGRLLGLIHNALRTIGRDPRLLLQAKDQADRARVFDEVFAPLYENGVLKWIGASPLSVFSLGIPPSQHAHMETDAEGKLLEEYRKRTRRLICAWPIEDNCFAYQSLCRGYDRKGRQGVPDYLKPEHYEVMKSRAERIDTRLMSTIDALEAADTGAFNAFVFLDSQDWMPPAVIERQWRAIARIAPVGSRVIFRTAASGSPIEGALPADLLCRFKYHREDSKRFYLDDRSAIYGGFHLYEVV